MFQPGTANPAEMLTYLRRKKISPAIHALTGTWTAKLSCTEINMEGHHPPYQSDCKAPPLTGPYCFGSNT